MQGRRLQNSSSAASGSFGCFLEQRAGSSWESLPSNRSCFRSKAACGTRAERQDEVTLPVGLSDSLAGEHGGDKIVSWTSHGHVDPSGCQGDTFLSSRGTPSCVSIRNTQESHTSCGSSSGHFQYESLHTSALFQSIRFISDHALMHDIQNAIDYQELDLGECQYRD